MRTRTIHRYRISCLSEEYLSKYRQVRRIIKQNTGLYPSAELTLEAMIDEFLNIHVGTDWEDSSSIDGNYEKAQLGSPAEHSVAV